MLAGVIRHQNGAVAAALRDEFDALDPTDLASDTPSLLLAVPALLRAALVTGEPTTGALLTDLAAHVEPNLSEVAEQVGRRALMAYCSTRRPSQCSPTLPKSSAG